MEKKARRVISIFLIYSFSPQQKAYSKSEIDAVLEEACTTARNDLRQLGFDVDIKYTYHLSAYGETLRHELIKKLSDSDICIVDVSDNNPNVFYEMGIVHALNKKTIVIKSNRDLESFKTPSDIRDLFLLLYDDINDIRGRLARAIFEAATETLGEDTRPNIFELAKAFWALPSEHHRISFVGPPSMHKTPFSDIYSDNYVYLDRLGDKDAIVEVSVTLARLYPELIVQRYTSTDFPRTLLEEDIISIGGPGSALYPGNTVTKMFIEYLRLPLSYNEDCNVMYVEGTEYTTEKKAGIITRDYGSFLRCVHPFNPRSKLVLIHGIHTYGVLGISRAFTLHPSAEKNLLTVLDVCGEDPKFWIVAPVEIHEGVAVIPEISKQMIMPLD